MAYQLGLSREAVGGSVARPGKECMKKHKEQISVGCAQALEKLKKEL